MSGFTGPEDGAVVQGSDPGPPLFQFGTGGSFTVNAPLLVSSLQAPEGSAVGFGAASFAGPVSIAVGAELPLAVDPDTGDTYLSSLSVGGSLQSSQLLVADESSNLWLKVDSSGARVYGDLTVDGTLYGAGGSPYNLSLIPI